MNVSVIIPCYDEESFIEKCIKSVLNQTYSKIIEILVVDGNSSDTTLKIVKKLAAEYSQIKILKNEKRYVQYAFNMGIENASGDIICIQGAHAYCPNDYIEKCIKLHKKYPNVANVGGVEEVLPRNNSLIAKAIAIAIANSFGIGKAQYRQARKGGFVNTVFPGCYKKEVFSKVGLYDERLSRGQDQELNYRINRLGGKIYLDTDIVVYFYARGTLSEMAYLYFRTGRSIVYSSKVLSNFISIRQFVPFLFILLCSFYLVVLSANYFFNIVTGHILFPLYSIIGLYGVINIGASLNEAIKKKDILLFFALPVTFVVLHFSYAFGTGVGFFTLYSWWKNNKNINIKKLKN